MILDIINKKRLGEELSYQELEYFFNHYLEGDIADYQMSSLLMAICINGMSEEETFALTKIFIDSGDVLDFSKIPGVKLDKHSTGGIGDKTTLVIAPIIASFGIPMIKMSGRGLGYTGGTIDKLESIPGFRVDLSDREIIKQVKDINLVVTGQTADLVPMDKVIYALRDVTSTVSSIPLIASSIMSKKIAGGADKILIDIKVGNGALLANQKEAKELSDLMIKIGKVYQKEVKCIISDMNTPLGLAVGNSLEVLEAIRVLQGKEEENNFTKLCEELSAEMLCMAMDISKKEAHDQVKESIQSGRAYQKFLEMVEYQKGDLSKIKVSQQKKPLIAYQSGVITEINALALGKLSLSLGAGKVSKKDKIDYSVGIQLKKQLGDSVKKGDILAEMYVNKKVPEVNIHDIFVISKKNV